MRSRWGEARLAPARVAEERRNVEDGARGRGQVGGTGGGGGRRDVRRGLHRRSVGRGGGGGPRGGASSLSRLEEATGRGVVAETGGEDSDADVLADGVVDHRPHDDEGIL